jgi:heme/copper-type cytochrome/quinol oxidase subunit 2
MRISRPSVSRRTFGFVLLGAGVYLLLWPARPRAQEQAPNRREFTITAGNYEFSPSRIEVTQDDLVKITVRSNDDAHSFVIDGYRIMKRVPAGGATTFEFRADRAGTFAFYCGMTNAEAHRRMKGELVVVAR